MKQHQERIEFLIASRARMETALAKKKDDLDLVVSFEERRVQDLAGLMAQYFPEGGQTRDEFQKYRARLKTIKEVSCTCIYLIYLLTNSPTG